MSTSEGLSGLEVKLKRQSSGMCRGGHVDILDRGC